ncbi:MAG: DUF5317 domain-containing protein [Actinomycetota bacterium]
MGGISILALVLVAALIAGRIRGGSLHQVSNASLRMAVLVPIALVLQALASSQGLLPDRLRESPVPTIAVVVSMALAAVFIGVNRLLPGMLVIALGLGLNAAVILANGAMPVSEKALDRAGVAEVPLDQRRPEAKHSRLTEYTRLSPLADVIPLPPARLVASAGDVAIWAGMFLLVQGLMLPSGRSRAARGARDNAAEPTANPASPAPE